MSELTAPRAKLLNLLADGECHSGEQLGQSLAMSRMAISKHIQVLKSFGLDIISVSGKGYQLAAPLQLLNQPLLRQALTPNRVEVIPVIESTNAYWMTLLDELNKGDICVAECQTAGRGRRGRTWISPFGGQLIMSMYWQLEQGMAAAMGLSLVVGITITETLNKLGFVGVALKWPNDLYVDGRKLAGILVEMAGTAGGPCHLVIGVGLNLLLPKAEQAYIDQPWAELAELGPVDDRNQLLITLSQDLQRNLQRFEQLGMAAFREQWNRLDYYNGQPVTLQLGERHIQGIARGIDEQGALLLENAQGMQRFVGGEVSLRGKNAAPNA